MHCCYYAEMTMRLGPLSQKILLLLAGGCALGFSRSPRHYGRLIKEISREWEKIERRALYLAIQRLYESKLIRYREHADGSVEIVLNREGRHQALRYQLNNLSIPKPARWDYKWRVVLFDIPEEQKKMRDALRERLKQLGLLEFQKSVFVHPHECRNEIDFMIELYQARRYVRFIEATRIDNELHLKKKFNMR